MFSKGQRVYKPNGDEAEFVALIEGGGFVVKPYCYANDFDEHLTGDVQIVDHVFEESPKRLRDEEIVRLDAEISAKRKELLDIVKAVDDAKRNVDERVRAMSAMQGMQRLEDWLVGRFTHVVLGRKFERSGIADEIDITSFEKGCEEIYDHRGVALLTLFGDSNGRLSWQINDYKDGSGQWRTVIPCLSEEEAKQKASELINHSLSTLGANDYDRLKNLTNSAKKLGIEIPAKYVEMRRLADRQMGEKQIAHLETQIAAAREKYLG